MTPFVPDIFDFTLVVACCYQIGPGFNVPYTKRKNFLVVPGLTKIFNDERKYGFSKMMRYLTSRIMTFQMPKFDNPLTVLSELYEGVYHRCRGQFFVSYVGEPFREDRTAYRARLLQAVALEHYVTGELFDWANANYYFKTFDDYNVGELKPATESRLLEERKKFKIYTGLDSFITVFNAKVVRDLCVKSSCVHDSVFGQRMWSIPMIRENSYLYTAGFYGITADGTIVNLGPDFLTGEKLKDAGGFDKIAIITAACEEYDIAPYFHSATVWDYDNDPPVANSKDLIASFDLAACASFNALVFGRKEFWDKVEGWNKANCAWTAWLYVVRDSIHVSAGVYSMVENGFNRTNQNG
jgi:hypothetical protein